MLRSHFLVALALVATLFASTASAQNIFAEDFSTASGTTPPVGWSVRNSGAPAPWRFDNPGGRAFDMAPIIPGFSGNFAISDPDWFGPSASGTTNLVSPSFATAGATVLNLTFDHQIRDLGSTTRVDAFDGSVWNNVADFSGTDVGYPSSATPTHMVDIAAAVGGAASSQIRFSYGHGYDWWWAVDNVSIDQPLLSDLAAISIDQPVNDPNSCVPFGNAETVVITCEWKGAAPLTAGSTIEVLLTVDGVLIGMPQFYLTPVQYNFGDLFQITLTETADLSSPILHTVDVTAQLLGGDLDPANDMVSGSYNGGGGQTPVNVGWNENFDSHTTAAGGFGNTAVPAGWVNDPNDQGSTSGATYPDWSNEDGTTGSGAGPAADHTTGVVGQGYYMYVEDSAGTDSTANNLITPCLDLSTAPGNPGLAFWHHSDEAAGSLNDNLLEVDIQDFSSGGSVTMSVGTFPGNGVGTDWTRHIVDLTPFGPAIVKAIFRGRNDNGTFFDDQAIDDVAFIDNTPDFGQAPQPGLATFDINNSVNLLGETVSSGNAGPYFSSVVEGGAFTLTSTGQPTQAITVIYGPLNRQVATYPGSGQLDIGTPDTNGDGLPEALSVFVDAIAWAGGGFIGFPIDAMFFTDAAGSNVATFTFPTFGLPSGTPITTFQNVLTQSGGAPVIGNAVDIVIQ